jgi:hypothetical protein
MALQSVSLNESMDTGQLLDQICSFVLGGSWLKLMFPGWPKPNESSRLLERAMSVHDVFSLALTLPNVSLLSIGLLADEYGAAVVTLQEKHAQMWKVLSTNAKLLWRTKVLHSETDGAH